jgi:TBC1 domain family protein 5
MHARSPTSSLTHRTMLDEHLVDRWNRTVAERYPDLALLRKSVWRGTLSSSHSPPRSLLWKVLLLYGTFDQKSWDASQERDFRRYTVLVKEYDTELTAEAVNGVSTAPEKPLIDDPLRASYGLEREDFEEQDGELKDVIMRDVERTFPEVEFFREPEIGQLLLRILYIYARQNPDIGYRQGMHELAGPILWVMINDAGSESKYVESDTWALFGAIMKHARPWYLPPAPDSTPVIVSKSHRIQETIVHAVDPELHRILKANDIEPQIWGIRWIRLLFGREFGFQNTLLLWDALFAADGSTLDLVDYVCATMLLRVRNCIVNAPYHADILLTLLNYPIDETEPPQNYVTNALYLKTHLSPEGGLYISNQYLHLWGPSRSTSSPFNLDSLKDAAKSVTQKLDIDRRVRDAFEKRSTSKDKRIEDLKRSYGDRNEALSRRLGDALDILDKLTVADSDKLENVRALNSLRYIRDCLLDDNIPLQPVSPLGRIPRVIDNDEPVEENVPSQKTHTPIRTSLLANSDFSWMLDSPGPSPPDIRTKFKGRPSNHSSNKQDLVSRSPPKMKDIFELR